MQYNYFLWTLILLAIVSLYNITQNHPTTTIDSGLHEIFLQHVLNEQKRLEELFNRIQNLSLHNNNNNDDNNQKNMLQSEWKHRDRQYARMEDIINLTETVNNIGTTLDRISKEIKSLHHYHSDRFNYKGDSTHTVNKSKTLQKSHDMETLKGTVVTAYFDIPSKHSPHYYLEWMSYMLAISDPIVIFTTSDWEEKIMHFRNHAKTLTKIIPVKLDELPISTLYNRSVWQHQFTLDPIAAFRKSYRLYWIWLSKTYFVHEAMRLNPFESTHFMWMDIGCFRFSTLNEYFANRTLMSHLDRIPNESMLMMAHKKIDPPTDPWFRDNSGSSEHFYTSGTSFAGNKNMFETFHKRFLVTLQGYLDRGLFVGEDQVILQSTCLQNNGLCQYVNPDEVRPSDTSYFALRTVLRFGGDHYQYWKPPCLKVA
jgi:Bacterial protein of unknown function (HtrL_YibB)